MQWRCDAITVSFAVIVVTLASLVPLSVAASLLALEATFAIAYVPLRLKQLALKHGESQLETADAIEEAICSAESGQATWLSRGLGALQALLDPLEAEAELVRRDGGRWFDGHWDGGVTASDLGLDDVADFLSYSREFSRPIYLVKVLFV